MNPRKRKIIFVICFILFIITAPAVVLYSLGYRWDNGIKFYKTGGIYVYSPIEGSRIFINGKEEKKIGLLQDGLFLQNLLPGKYSIVVTNEDYWPWNKDIVVKEQVVSEVSPLLIPVNPKGEVVFKKNFSSLEPSKYDEVLKLIEKTYTIPDRKATSIEVENFYTRIHKNGKEKIWWDNKLNKIWAEWLGDINSLPYFFCNDKNCSGQVLVYSTHSKIKNIDFYPRRKDVILFADQNGVYAIEIDGRGKKRNMAPVYKGKNPFFVVYNNKLYILDEDNLIEINLP